LSDYEHIAIQYVLHNGIATQRQVADSQGIGRTQVQQLWREPVPYSAQSGSESLKRSDDGSFPD
jgi:hypothetical protein